MTEDQAREKWCPMGRFPYWPNECSGGNEGIKCIASDCMMYRTYGVTEEIDGGKYTTQHGYCGLAGKP